MAYHSDSSPIRWGILGCGDVTEKKSGPAFREIAGSELVAVMRRNRAKAKDYATRHGVPRYYDDADALIHDSEVDIVYVATPPGTHCEYALRVARAGKPCYVEKPMARNATECRRMVEAFEKASLPLFVAYYRRGLPRFLEAKRLVESGELGPITSIVYHFASGSHKKLDPENLPWRVDAEQSGGGIFLDMASHTLDALDFIFGPLEEVTGRAWNRGTPVLVEDVVHVQFVTPDGIPGTGVWNFASDQPEDRIEIEGSAGKLVLSTFGDEALGVLKGADFSKIARPNPRTIQQPLIQTIVEELNGRGQCPSTGKTALRTSRVMDSVLEAYYGGRDDSFWERPETWPGSRS